MRRGIGVLAVLAVAVAGGVGGFSFMTGEPNEIRVELDPANVVVAVNETATLVIEVENVDVNAITLKAVGLEQGLLDGIVVEQSEPMYRSIKERSHPIHGSWTEYALDYRLQGGEKLTLTLTLRAVQAGTLKGDIMVWVDSDVVGVSVARARRAPLEIVVN